jgi:FtsH-binding integral membrane protein
MLVLGNKLVFYGLLLGELALVFSLVGFIKKMPSSVATVMFVLYSFVTGLTLSVIFLVYEISSIGFVFLLTAGMFGVMSVYGYVTKKDLTGVGSIMIMALIGVIIASIANFFLNSSVLDWILSFISVIIFTALTAYDTQKIKKMNVLGNEGSDEDKKEAIMGALSLYLDFINLFLNLLRLFGKRRR